MEELKEMKKVYIKFLEDTEEFINVQKGKDEK